MCIFFFQMPMEHLDFLAGSDSKEGVCNVKDLIGSLGWEDPLEKGITTNSSILALENSTDREAWQAVVHRVANNCI